MPEDKENFTKLDNVLLELMAHGYFTLNEIRVLLVILRHTAGWHRESVQMSTSDLSKMTGIQSRHVNTAVNGLKEKSVISIVQNGKTDVKEFYINTYDTFCHKTSFVIRHFLSQDLGQNLSQDLGQNLSQATPLKPLQSEGYSVPKENIKKYKERERKGKTPRKTVHRKLYGQFKNVPFSDEELNKLKEQYPNDWAERIERVSEYAASTGKVYKNGLATIQNWDRRDKEKQPQKIQSQPKPAGPRFNP